MAAKRTTITIKPKFNSNGNVVGWFVSDGQFSLEFDTLKKAQGGLNRSIKLRVSEGYTTVAKVYDSKGQLVSGATYTAITGEMCPITVPKRPSVSKKPAARKAPSKAPSAAKPSTPAKYGRDAYNRFKKRASASGLTKKQTSAAWKSYKTGKVTIADAIAKKPSAAKKAPSKKAPPKKKASTKKPTATKKTPAKHNADAYNRFKKRGTKAGYTLKQVSVKWKQYKSGGKTIAELLPAKATKPASKKAPAKKAPAKKAPAKKARTTATALPSPKGGRKPAKSKSTTEKLRKPSARKKGLPPALKRWNNYVGAVKEAKGYSHTDAMKKAKGPWSRFSDAQKAKASSKAGARSLPMPR